MKTEDLGWGNESDAPPAWNVLWQAKSGQSRGLRKFL